MRLKKSQLRRIIQEELQLVVEQSIAQQAAADRARQRAGELEGERGHTDVHRGEAEDVRPTHPGWVDKAGEWLLAHTGEGTTGGDVVAGMEDLGRYGGPVGRGLEKYVVTPFIRDPVETWAAGQAPQNLPWEELEQQRQAERRANLPGIFDFDINLPRFGGGGSRERPEQVDPMVATGRRGAEYWAPSSQRPDFSQYAPPEPPAQAPRMDTSRLATDPRVVRFHDDAPGQAERRAERFAVRSGQVPASSLAENYLPLNEMIERQIDTYLYGDS